MIKLEHIRISNFKSIENIDLKLRPTNILVGQNNCGKSNFLKAIDLVFSGNRIASEQDIYISDGENISIIKYATIDVLLIPIDHNGIREKEFSNFWTSVFTTWISTDTTNGDFVGIRAEIKFDVKKNDYTISRFPITEWGDNIESSKKGKKSSFGSDMSEYLTTFYVDAHRDINEDLRSRKSYFGKITSSNKLSEAQIEELERQLNDINSQIIDNLPSLQHLTQKMATIGTSVGHSISHVEIEPLARKISDIHKGMDIMFKDYNAAKLSIALHGMGTRSWLSFLILGAYIDWISHSMQEEDSEAESYILLALEEPEAHLHPQAQKQLYTQLLNFNGQKIISTHSSSILAQTDIQDIIYFKKEEGKTHASIFEYSKYSQEELNKIRREILNTRGDLIFSNVIILCEGITEEQALPIFFNEYFGIDPSAWGINIIGIGGQNYKTFLNLAHNFDIKWFIFSDGESKAKNALKKAVVSINNLGLSNLDLSHFPTIVILDNDEDYEKHLLASKYEQEMIRAINDAEGSPDYFTKYVSLNDQKSAGRILTEDPPCPACNQNIYKIK